MRQVLVNEARRDTTGVIADFYDRALVYDKESGQPYPVVGLQAPFGIGKSDIVRRKTAEALELLRGMRAAGDKRTISIAVPTHKLGDEAVALFEVLEDARRLGLTAAAWRGREANDPEQPGQAMCQNLPAVRESVRLGLNVQATACRTKVNGIEHKCPFFNQCGTQRQSQQRADVWFVPHELLFTEKPATIGELAALIIDEGFLRAGLGGVNPEQGTKGLVFLPLDTLSTFDRIQGDDVATQELTFLRKRVQDAARLCKLGALPRTALLATGITPERCTEAIALEYRRKIDPKILPDDTLNQRTAKAELAEANATIGKMVTVWRAIRDLVADDGPEFSGRISIVQLKTENGPIKAFQLRWRKEIRDGWKVPTLLIDALLSPNVVKQFFPTIEIRQVGRVAAPYQSVTQIKDRSYSHRYLNENAKNPKDARVAKRHVRNLHATICRAARKTNGTVVVVAQQDIEAALTERGNIPSNVTLAHHNGVSGSDRYKDARALIVIGRTQPSPDSVEAIAGALTGAAVTPIDGWYPNVTVNRKMADGSIQPAEAARHPDPVAEAVRQLICEGELMQIVGRPRGINREQDKPVDILLLTNQPVPFPIDRLIGADELDPSPFDLQAAAGGLVFDSGTAAATAYPGLWKSAGAARDAFSAARGSSAGFSQIDYLMGESFGALPAERAGWWAILCRKAKPGAHWFRVWGDPNVHPKPQPAVEAILGPIEWKWDDAIGQGEVEAELLEAEEAEAEAAAEMAQVAVGPAWLVCECGEEHFTALSSAERFQVQRLESKERSASERRQRAKSWEVTMAMLAERRQKRKERRQQNAEWYAEYLAEP